MRKLTPQRRRATVLAACACILASAPTALSSAHPTSHAFEFFRGMALGIALVLLVASAVLLTRERKACNQ